MNDRRSSSDLGSSAEATLSAFPFPERDWENDARAVETRLLSATRGSTDDALLAAPLPSEADEPSALSATTTPLANSGVRTQSLAELARRSVEKKQASQREMAKESLAIAAQQRPIPVAPIAHVVPVASDNAQPPAPVAAPTPFPKLALALPALALAAAALFWFRPPAPAALSATTALPSAVTPSAPTAVADHHAAPARDLPRGVDPDTLPGEAPRPTEATPSKPAPTGTVAVLQTPAKPITNPRTTPAAPSNEADVVQKSLPPDPGMRPADSSGGQLPTKPSSGAVQAALGSVLSGARHCVAGDDAPSSAVVVFGSDGRVQRVTVSGAAAGKSSASCIEAQLSRARVQPFAAPNFSVNATVRPE